MSDYDKREVNRLRKINKELLAALIVAERAMQADIRKIDIGAAFVQVRAAITKAKQT